MVIGPNSSAIGNPVTDRKNSPPLSSTFEGASELIFSTNVNVFSFIDVGVPLEPDSTVNVSASRLVMVNVDADVAPAAKYFRVAVELAEAVKLEVVPLPDISSVNSMSICRSEDARVPSVPS